MIFDRVSKLQEAIAASYNIQPDKQVMLISGGENLDPNARVCSYSAGTVRLIITYNEYKKLA